MRTAHWQPVYTLELADAGWQTVTSESRLNALACAFNVQGVYQNSFTWYFDNGIEWGNWRLQYVS